MKKKVIIGYPLIIFLGINILSFLLLIYFYKNDFSNYVVFKTLLFIVLLWLPYLISKVVDLDFPKLIYQLYFLIIFSDIMLGSIFMINGIFGLYKYIVLLFQGVAYLIFGLWLIKFLDDYGYMSYKLIVVFSYTFAISFASIKELLLYLFEKLFKDTTINHLQNLLIIICGITFSLIVLVVDNIYYKGKYYRLLDRYLIK